MRRSLAVVHLAFSAQDPHQGPESAEAVQKEHVLTRLDRLVWRSAISDVFFQAACSCSMIFSGPRMLIARLML